MITLIDRLSQFFDFFLASVLLTIVLVMTNKKWRGIKDFLLIIVGSSISGYLFSNAIKALFPWVYALSEQLWNTFASVGIFLILLIIVEKDYWKIAKEIVEKKIEDKINSAINK